MIKHVVRRFIHKYVEP